MCLLWLTMQSEYKENVTLSVRSKKRKPNNSQWRKTLKSQKVNSRLDKNPKLSCAHDNKMCRAQTLSGRDVEGKLYNILIISEVLTSCTLCRFLYKTLFKSKRCRSVPFLGSVHKD